MPADAPPLTLCQRLAIALVPASVPALVIVIALGLAIGIGELPKPLDAFFEQVAGGALLITYIKELFPKVMEQGDVAVDALMRGKPAKCSIAGCPLPRLACTKIWCTMLMVGCIAASAVGQAAAAGFPGVVSFDSLNATANATHSGGDEGDAEAAFTPASTIAYFVGFFVDGVVLAYDDDPVRCDVTLVKKLVMSFVFAVDNLLDGFGLAPVLKIAFGEPGWMIVMMSFSVCVLAGATFTACLRWAFPSPVLHLIFISLSTTSILVGALQLTPHGLSVYVMVPELELDLAGLPDAPRPFGSLAPEAPVRAPSHADRWASRSSGWSSSSATSSRRVAAPTSPRAAVSPRRTLRSGERSTSALSTSPPRASRRARIGTRCSIRAASPCLWRSRRAKGCESACWRPRPRSHSSREPVATSGTSSGARYVDQDRLCQAKCAGPHCDSVGE